MLTECPLFSVYNYELCGNVELNANEDSFNHILVVDGSGKIGGREFKKGDSFFVPANYGNNEIDGNGEFILTKV